MVQMHLIIKRFLDKLNIQWTDEELEMHRNIGRGRSCQCSLLEITHADSWLQNLLDINIKEKQYENKYLSDMLSLVWYRLCFNNSSLGMKVLGLYVSGSQVKNDMIGWKRSMMLFLSIVKNKMTPTQIS